QEEIRERINKGKEDKEQRRRETEKKVEGSQRESTGDDDASSSARFHELIQDIKPTINYKPPAPPPIPVVNFNSHNFKNVVECVVCLSNLLADGDKARVLPTCNHWFHAHCIDLWFQSHSTCPVCRNIVGLAENHYSGFEPDESPTNSLPTTNTAVIEDSDETNEVQPDQICSRCVADILIRV
ncbi:unnamed protein product, partial [Brassica rapa subsp. narinosa]